MSFLALAVAVACAALAPAPCLAAGKKEPSSESWPEVTPAERALTSVPQDPEADAVVLLNERNGKIVPKGGDTVNVIDHHVRFKILTDRGKRYADVEIAAGKYSRVSNIRARTIKPDGTAAPVAPDQIFEKVTFQVGAYKETAWVFSFPAVERGAILEYRYDRHDNSVVFIDPFYFAGPEFTLRARMTQAIPDDMGYWSLCDHCPGSQPPAITNWREGKVKGKLYSQELRDLPGYKDELFMPPARDVSPRIEFVLLEWKRYYWPSLGRQDRVFIDWPSVAQHTAHNYQGAVKDGLSSLKPVVDGWLQGITDPQEKIKTIFRHVQRDFRYLSFLDVYGRVRSIETMVKDRIADNEDKAVLLMAALKTIGIEAHAALVSGKNGGSLNPKFFSLSQFTHAVVALPQAGGGYLWLDPTVTYAPFAFLPWKDSGAEALLIKGKEGEMIALPSRNEISASRYKIGLKPRSDGKADLDVEAEFLGEDAIDLRDDLAPAAEAARLAFMQKWVAGRRPGAALRSHTIEDLDDVEKPLRITMKIEAPGLVTTAEDILLVRGCVLTCEETNPISRGARQYPFFVDRGWNEEETVVIQPVDGIQAGPMPPSVMAKSEVGTLTFSCLPHGDGGARCARQFVARRNRWPASVQENVRKMFDKVIEADRTTVALQPSEAGAAGR
ncbi:MAG: DUF3857 and transglutaminase domain-containing protein [Acidobacteria bacterium]|nr:DUF3857 and transglutaminase domain-containing protein [Acidobacteriota bacterium]